MNLRNKNILTSAGIIVLFAIAAISIASVSKDRDKKSILSARLEAYCDAIYYANAPSTNLPHGIQVSIIRPDGTVISDSRTNPENMENHLPRPELRPRIDSANA